MSFNNPPGPLPWKIQYHTWLEWGSYNLDGKLANWVVFPLCGLLSQITKVWPHAHKGFYMGKPPAGKRDSCVFCGRYFGERS